MRQILWEMIYHMLNVLASASHKGAPQTNVVAIVGLKEWTAQFLPAEFSFL